MCTITKSVEITRRVFSSQNGQNMRWWLGFGPDPVGELTALAQTPPYSWTKGEGEGKGEKGRERAYEVGERKEKGKGEVEERKGTGVATLNFSSEIRQW